MYGSSSTALPRNAPLPLPACGEQKAARVAVSLFASQKEAIGPHCDMEGMSWHSPAYATNGAAQEDCECGMHIGGTGSKTRGASRRTHLYRMITVLSPARTHDLQQQAKHLLPTILTVVQEEHWAMDGISSQMLRTADLMAAYVGRLRFGGTRVNCSG